ncbi:C-terminal binding protein [bacterium]|nr:C-terminal binding protein [bacterium]
MSARAQVVVTDYIMEPAWEGPIIAPHADLLFAGAIEDVQLLPTYQHADVLLVFHDIKITSRVMGEFPRLKGIVRCGVGVDNVDLVSAGANGIVVCNVPDYGTEDVADHALMMLLAIARRLKKLDDSIRQGEWDATLIYGAPRMRGRTIGILGSGRIGSAMALRAKALGLRVIIYDPYQPPGYEKAIGVERCFELEPMLRQADFLSVHTPLTAETHHILNRDTLHQLPRGAYVVNTARGPCIDLNALVDAIDEGHIAGAGLDVVEREPLDDERIRQHPQILLTPHAAFYSMEAFMEMRSKAGEEAVRILTGQPIRNPVNRKWLQHSRAVLPRVLE